MAELIAERRRQKAEFLAKVLRASGANATNIVFLPEYGWQLAVDLVNAVYPNTLERRIGMPSSDTKKMVIRLLKQGETNGQ